MDWSCGQGDISVRIELRRGLKQDQSAFPIMACRMDEFAEWASKVTAKDAANGGIELALPGNIVADD